MAQMSHPTPLLQRCRSLHGSCVTQAWHLQLQLRGRRLEQPAPSRLGLAAITTSPSPGQEKTPPSQAPFLFAAAFRGRSGQVWEEKHWGRVLGRGVLAGTPRVRASCGAASPAQSWSPPCWSLCGTGPPHCRGEAFGVPSQGGTAPPPWAPAVVAPEPGRARLGELGCAAVPPKSAASQGTLSSGCPGGLPSASPIGRAAGGTNW